MSERITMKEIKSYYETTNGVEYGVLILDRGGNEGVHLPMLSWELARCYDYFLKPTFKSDGEIFVSHTNTDVIWDIALPTFDYFMPRNFLQEIVEFTTNKELYVSFPGDEMVIMTDKHTITMKLLKAQETDLKEAKSLPLCYVNKDKLLKALGKSIRYYGNDKTFITENNKLHINNKSIPALVIKELNLGSMRISARIMNLLNAIPGNQVMFSTNANWAFIGDGFVKMPFGIVYHE